MQNQIISAKMLKASHRNTAQNLLERRLVQQTISPVRTLLEMGLEIGLIKRDFVDTEGRVFHESTFLYCATHGAGETGLFDTDDRLYPDVILELLFTGWPR